MATLFTQIINGDIPSHQVYEDDKTFAFMDINPVRPGHVLVITKAEVVTFEQLNEADYSALMATVQKIAKKIKQELQPARVGVIIEGFDVPHVHVKLIPINNEAELRQTPEAKEPDHTALAATAERLRISEV